MFVNPYDAGVYLLGQFNPQQNVSIKYSKAGEFPGLK